MCIRDRSYRSVQDYLLTDYGPQPADEAQEILEYWMPRSIQSKCEPVSYTHLDVYKRQIHDFTNRNE